MEIKGPKDYLKLGDWNVLCDVCGFKFKASELRKRWDGYMCCSKDWEERQPQDLIRLPRERQAPSWARPSPPPTYETIAPVDPNVPPVTTTPPPIDGYFAVVKPVDPNDLPPGPSYP